MKRSQKWVYVILVFTAFILYGNTIPNNYSLDDSFVITGNSNVQKGIAGIPSIVTNKYISNKNISIDYRPVVLISYAIEYQFFKTNPHVSHFINILLYALCLIAIYLVLKTIFKLDQLHPFMPLIITLFYAAHPIHTEVVASLKNRDELFSMLFGMRFIYHSFHFFDNDNKKLKSAIYAILFIFLSVVSKLIGIVFLGFLLVLLVYKRIFKINFKNILFMSVLFVIVIAVIKFNAANVNRYVYVFENSLALNNNVLILIATSAKILLYHIKMLFIPYPLRFYYGYNLFPVDSFFEFQVLLSIVIHVFLLLFGTILMYRKNVIGVFIFSYLGCLVMYCNYPYLYIGMFSERALMVSSFWFISFLVVLSYNIFKRLSLKVSFNTTLLVILPIFSIYSYMTIVRNFNWKDAITLMSHDIPHLEKSVNANYIYANNLVTGGKNATDTAYGRSLIELSTLYFYKTIKLFPSYPVFHFRLAQVYKDELNKPEKAILHLKNSLVIDSTYVESNFELGKIYSEQNNFNTSTFYLKKVYEKGNRDSLLFFYLAQNANSINDLEACYSINLEYKKLYPNLEYPYMNLGVYYSKKLRDDLAVEYFEKAVELGNRNQNLLQEMLKYFQKKKDPNKIAYYTNLLNQRYNK